MRHNILTMNTKHYSALFAFVAAFTFSAVIASFFKVEQGTLVLWDDSKTAQKITRLLEQDIAHGRDRAVNEDYAITTLAYVDNSESLDDSNLPSDFRRAWRAHMRAWRNHSDFLIDGKGYKSRAQIERRWTKNVNEINYTWKRVLLIAKEHGAEIPEDAY